MKLYTACTCGNASFVTPFTYQDHKRGGSLATLQPSIPPYYTIRNDTSLRPAGKLCFAGILILFKNVASAFSKSSNKYFQRIEKFSRKNSIKCSGLIKPNGGISPSP